MNAAALYQHNNYVQRRDARSVLAEYSSMLQWRLDGEDSLIDIGCGSGDVLMDFVHPLMPKNFSKLVGVDKGEKMIRHAQKFYKKYDRVYFELLDIEGNLNDNYRNQYDHVTSFYCWHWIQNQRKALQNVYNMLHEDGDCLFAFLASNPVYDVYKSLSKNPKWAPYMTDVNNYISPFHYKKNSAEEFQEMLVSAGFSDVHVEVKDLIYLYEGAESLKRNNKAINPFVSRIPTGLQNEYMNEYVKTVIDMNFSEKTADGKDYTFPTPYKLLISYARK